MNLTLFGEVLLYGEKEIALQRLGAAKLAGAAATALRLGVAGILHCPIVDGARALCGSPCQSHEDGEQFVLCVSRPISWTKLCRTHSQPLWNGARGAGAVRARSAFLDGERERERVQSAALPNTGVLGTGDQ